MVMLHPKLGPWVRDYLDGEGLPLKGKNLGARIDVGEHQFFHMACAFAVGACVYVDQRCLCDCLYPQTENPHFINRMLE